MTSHEEWHELFRVWDKQVPGGIMQLLGAPDWYLETLVKYLPDEYQNREIAALILQRRREPPEQDVIDVFQMTFQKNGRLPK
jgi:hypothetical protein